jgi:4-carboxymuconolactone decarboxylase
LSACYGSYIARSTGTPHSSFADPALPDSEPGAIHSRRYQDLTVRHTDFGEYNRSRCYLAMSRIAPLTPASLDAAQRAVYDDILRTRGGAWFHGPYDALLQQPALAGPAQELGNVVRFQTSLPSHLTEMAILLVARHWSCEFEWCQHAPLAAQAGLQTQLIEDIRTGRSIASQGDDEQALFRLTMGLLNDHKVSDDDYREATQRFGTVGVVELTALLGYYSFLALTLIAHEISLPGGAEPAFCTT